MCTAQWRGGVNSMYCRHFLQYVPAYWQTKHTSGALHNSGGVATVAAIQRQQGVLLPCWRKKKTAMNYLWHFHYGHTAPSVLFFFSFYNSCANLPTRRRSQVIKITFWHVCASVCSREKRATKAPRNVDVQGEGTKYLRVKVKHVRHRSPYNENLKLARTSRVGEIESQIEFRLIQPSPLC